MSNIDPKRPRSWGELAKSIYPDLAKEQERREKPAQPSQSMWDVQKRALGLVRKEGAKK
jgi:hypothetical protein